MLEVKERGCYNETNFQKIKDLRKDTEETTDRLEEILTVLEGVYIGGSRVKETKELKDI